MEKRPSYPVIAGAYRAYVPGGESFVGISRNVTGTVKRLKLELTLNACSYRPLQQAWNENGPMEFELLEELDETQYPDDTVLTAHLRAAQLRWSEKLAARRIEAGV